MIVVGRNGKVNIKSNPNRHQAGGETTEQVSAEGPGPGRRRGAGPGAAETAAAGGDAAAPQGAQRQHNAGGQGGETCIVD